MQTNLPTHVQALCSVLKDEEYPFAIAGSSVLAMHQQNWSPNNVDIFLPLAPICIKEYFRQGDPFLDPRLIPDNHTFYEGFTSDYLHYILILVYKRYKTILRMTSLHELEPSLHWRYGLGPPRHDVEFEDHSPLLLALSWIGVCMVVNLEHLVLLEDNSGPIFRKSSPNIRLIISEKFPEHPSIKWGQSIIDSFDISICKLYLDETDLIHVDSKASDDLARKQFSITIKPNIKWSALRGRVLKYLKRGFSLDKIIYDDRLSAEFKAYIMEEFRYLARNVLASRIYSDHACKNGDPPTDFKMTGELSVILDENLGKFLRPSLGQRSAIYANARSTYEQIEEHRTWEHRNNLYERVALFESQPEQVGSNSWNYWNNDWARNNQWEGSDDSRLHGF
jgi:hypothetical protein